MFKNILIPTDGSPTSVKAIKRGMAIAKAIRAKAIGLHAAPPVTPIAYREGFAFRTLQKQKQIIKRSSQRHLDVITRAARKARVRLELVQVTSDFPDRVILDTAKKKKCDLIVIGSHGQGGLRGVFIGSTAQKVLNQSKIPVMIIR